MTISEVFDMGEQVDCARCVHFCFDQDTDDWGREIAPPIYSCLKNHLEMWPTECEDYEDAYNIKSEIERI